MLSDLELEKLGIKVVSSGPGTWEAPSPPPGWKPKPGMPKNAAEASAMARNEAAEEKYKHLLEEKANVPYNPGPCALSMADEDTDNEHYRHYMDLIRESNGYYIPKVPDGVKIGYWRPAPVLPYDFDKLTLPAKDALDWYNRGKNEEESYELMNVECGSKRVLRGNVYYVAFIARSVETGTEVPLRAVVHYEVGGVITVKSCEKVAESCARFTKLNGRCC